MSAPRIDLTDWLLTKAERGNPRTRARRRPPGRAGLVRGQPGPAADPRVDVLRRALRADRGHRDGDLVFFTDWQGDADERLTGEPGSEVAEVLGRADERGVDVRGLVWRSHQDALGFTAEENRAARPRAAEARRRGAARHAGPAGRLAPPEDGRDPAPGRPDPRHRLRRRHRPVPLASRRRRPRRRPAGARRWRRSTATPRRGTTSRPRSAGRPCTTSRRCSASAGRTRRR